MPRPKGELSPEAKAKAETKRRYRNYLREYIGFPSKKRMTTESFDMLKEAINYLHPEHKQRGSEPLTPKVIAHLKECKENNEQAAGMDILDLFGLGLKGMKDIIKDAIINHQVWIGDDSATEGIKPSRVSYWIEGEGEQPEGWVEKGGYVYVPRKRKNKDDDDSDGDDQDDNDNDDDGDDEENEDEQQEAVEEVFGT